MYWLASFPQCTDPTYSKHSFNANFKKKEYDGRLLQINFNFIQCISSSLSCDVMWRQACRGTFPNSPTTGCDTYIHFLRTTNLIIEISKRILRLEQSYVLGRAHFLRAWSLPPKSSPPLQIFGSSGFTNCSFKALKLPSQMLHQHVPTVYGWPNIQQTQDA